jgi:hypothetical protein
MANKDLFKQAIAEAKSVREAAIANAKEALEETLTPHLKDMLAAKLQEMDAKSEEVEEVVNESEEVEETLEEAPKKDDEMDEAIDEAPAKDKEMDEANYDDKKDEAIEEEDLTEVEPVEAADDMGEAEDDSEESEDEAEHDEQPDGDEDISNLSVDQFKDMIRDIIAQEVGGDAAADDMDAGDIEGMGDEAGIEEPGMEPEAGEGEEEIDLDELIRELDAISEGDDEKEMEEGKKEDDMDEATDTVEEDTSVQVNAESDGTDYNINRVADLKEDATEDKSELGQALDTIQTLRSELNEVNILNAKLLYVNKIFKANNLSESQKVNIIAAFDKAETVKEVKLVFETVADNVGTKKETTIKEHKGSASKATGTTAKKPEVISEVSNAVLRMQKLAGIIK